MSMPLAARLDDEIERHRLLTDERLERLLASRASIVPLAAVREAIFEAGNTDFHAFVVNMLAALDCRHIDTVDDEVIELIEDAWNYFPHRALGGRSPAQVMLSLVGREPTRHRRQSGSTEP